MVKIKADEGPEVWQKGCGNLQIVAESPSIRYGTRTKKITKITCPIPSNDLKYIYIITSEHGLVHVGVLDCARWWVPVRLFEGGLVAVAQGRSLLQINFGQNGSLK